MATQVSLNDGAVASAGALAIQTNGTTQAVSISTGQVATLAQNPILTSGTANGVAYLNGSKALTTGSALTFDGTTLTGTQSTAAQISLNNSSGNYLFLTAAGGNSYIDNRITGGATNFRNGGAYTWSTYGGSDRMTLDTSGNLGLGVTPSAWTNYTGSQVGALGGLNLGGSVDDSFVGSNVYYNVGYKFARPTTATYATMYRQTGGVHSWQTSTATGTAGNAITFTQAMTLDSSGNLKVGTGGSGNTARVLVVSADATASTNAIYVENSTPTRLFQVRSDGYFITGAAANSPYNNTTASAANMFVDSGGVLYRSTSSLKYKTNVQDATHGLADLLQLRSVTYEGKSEADAGKTFGGLIAEEVHEAGLTEFVQYAEDGTPDALAYGNMVSLCIKAIQEQQALITQLQADVAALKGA